MSINFAQWKKRIGKKGRSGVPSVLYIYGSETVLKEEVLADVWELVNPHPWDSIRTWAYEYDENDLWTLIFQFSLDSTGTRLVQVRDAEVLANWRQLDHWVESRRGSTASLVFVSSEDKPVDWPVSRGQLVDCRMPAEEDLIAWVQSKLITLDRETARYLLRRTGSNLYQVSNVCAKLQVFSGRPGPGVIDELVDQGPAEAFADALLSLDKRSACLAAASVPPSDLGRVVGLLDSRLALLSRLRAHGMTPREMQAIPDVPVFLAKRYAILAKYYDPDKVLRRRKVLAVADGALSRGADSGVLESITALW